MESDLGGGEVQRLPANIGAVAFCVPKAHGSGARLGNVFVLESVYGRCQKAHVILMRDDASE
jgi:hypothetical protein